MAHLDGLMKGTHCVCPGGLASLPLGYMGSLWCPAMLALQPHNTAVMT